MSLQQQLITEMKEALRAGDKLRLDAIRYLRSQIKNHELDHGEQDDVGIQKIVATQVKQIKESIEEYQKAGRDDLVKAEEGKLAVMMSYLPEQMSEAEIKAIINEVIANQTDLQPGPVIGQVMKKIQGKAEGSEVARLVAAALGWAGIRKNNYEC